MRSIGAFVALIFILFPACKSQSQPIAKSDAVQTNQNSTSRTVEKVLIETDPTVGWGEGDIVGQKLRKAWKRFAADGHYRMAQPDDFRFSEAAKLDGDVRRFITRPYIYWWGAFAVVVVDTTRQSDDRFGIILFLDPKDLYDSPVDKGEPFKPVWLNRERDLSRTTLIRASGYWFINEHFDDGTIKTCEVDWSKNAKKYICR